MIRWLIYLVATLFAESLALMLCGILPLVRVYRFGPIDNRSGNAVAERLPLWLAWFDTPDNSLMGDAGHQARHATSSRYWTMTCWLARNRAYGLKWSVLSAPMRAGERQITGDPRINSNIGRAGMLRITMGKYWQWKLVWPVPKTARCIELNLGWLLDDASQQRALFMCSPRLPRFRQ